MSTMLEQAIIDAAALRETAMKSAEAALIEKYKDVFQDTVEKLLEQEETPPATEPAEVDQDVASANAADPTGPTLAPLPTGTENLGTAVPQQDPNKKDVFKKVKSAFFDLEGDDDELITINFDQLKSNPNQQSAMIAQPGSPMMEELELEFDELDEGLIVKIGEMYDASRNSDASKYNEEDELDEASDADSVIGAEQAQIAKNELAIANSKKNIANAKVAKASKESEKDDEEKTENSSEELEETVELTEDELLELEEALKIDMDNVPEGYMGSHNRKEREFKKVANAKARDDKETSRREWAKKNLSDLQEALEKVATMYVEEKEKVGSLESSNQNLLTVVSTLKEQLEKMNLSNAKLLYTNKVLSNASLNERQKTNIVENITKAESVSEAKTIYETLQSTVQSVTSQKTPKSLSEALNRGPSPFLVRKTQTASIEDLMSERLKRLAGIKT